jgi:hypothetical protein
MVSLAGNHIADCGAAGICRYDSPGSTQLGIAHAGAGATWPRRAGPPW